MLESGCWSLFLPTYSPDLNPIEMAVSNLKDGLRKIGARTFTDKFSALAEICDRLSPDGCWEFLQGCQICLRLKVGCFKEAKCAFRWTWLSCRKFRDNEVRLQLRALTYNLATFLRCIELPEAMAEWSLTRLKLKMIKIGACCASRPCHHLPVGRDGRHLSDGARNTRRQLTIANAITKRITAIRAQTERK